MNGRWAMLGVVGCLVPEVLGYSDWVQAPTWVRLFFVLPSFGLRVLGIGRRKSDILWHRSAL